MVHYLIFLTVEPWILIFSQLWLPLLQLLPLKFQLHGEWGTFFRWPQAISCTFLLSNRCCKSKIYTLKNGVWYSREQKKIRTERNILIENHNQHHKMNIPSLKAWVILSLSVNLVCFPIGLLVCYSLSSPRFHIYLQITFFLR